MLAWYRHAVAGNSAGFSCITLKKRWLKEKKSVLDEGKSFGLINMEFYSRINSRIDNSTEVREKLWSEKKQIP